MAMRRWLALVISLLPLATVAMNGTNLETQIKAAYLYKFCLYVQWPDATFKSEDAPIVIGVANHDSLAEALQRIVANRRVRERPIQVLRIDTKVAVDGIHVLYLGAGTNTALKPLADAAARLPILTVTEQHIAVIPRILDFTIIDNRVRFDVQLGQAKKVGLHLSAELLSVARVVDRPSQESP